LFLIEKRLQDEKTLRKKNKGTAPAPDATTTEPGPAGSVLSEEPEDPAANPIRLLYHGFVNQQGHFVGVYGLVTVTSPTFD